MLCGNGLASLKTGSTERWTERETVVESSSCHIICNTKGASASALNVILSNQQEGGGSCAKAGRECVFTCVV